MAIVSSFPAQILQIRSAFDRILRAIEPWYDWGTTTIWRLDQVERDFSDESEGEAYRFEIQWFDVHFAVLIGRTPPKVTPEERDRRKAIIAAREACR